VASLFILLLEKESTKTYATIAICALLVSLAFLTIQRNNQWANPIEFYQNETNLSPNKERVWAELGKVYIKDKQYAEALKALGKALNLGKDGNTINALPTTFLNTYLALLYSGQIKKAIYFESIMPVTGLTQHDKSVFYYMQANRQIKTKEYKKAINNYLKSSKLNPQNLEAKANLAALYIETGKVQQGKSLLNSVLSTNPKHEMALMYQKKYK